MWCCSTSDWSISDLYTLWLVEPGTGPASISVRSQTDFDNPLQKLTELKIENNNLDGVLPDLVPYCKARSGGSLSTFSFHGNDFSGKLPQSFAFCTGVTELELKNMPSMTGPLPDFEPSLQSCSACMPASLNVPNALYPGGSQDPGECPRWTDNVVYDPATNPYPGKDGNDAYLRPEGSGARPGCCRMYKCHTGGFQLDTFNGVLNPAFDLGTDEAAASCDTLCAAGYGTPPAGSPLADIPAAPAARCKVYANEYDFFFPPWIVRCVTRNSN